MRVLIEGLPEAAPLEAVALCRTARTRGQQDALAQLDRYLASRFLHLILDMDQESPLKEALQDLGLALVDAQDLAREAGEATWEQRWAGLLDLVGTVESMPSLTRDLSLLPTGRGMEILQWLRQRGRPVRSGDIARALQMKPPQVSRLVNRLVEAGLVHREVSGKAVWLELRPLGAETAVLARPSERSGAPRQVFWRGLPDQHAQVD